MALMLLLFAEFRCQAEYQENAPSGISLSDVHDAAGERPYRPLSMSIS